MWRDHHAEAVAAILAALREAKLASIGGGIAVSSAIWGWLGASYHQVALLVGVFGVALSATGVLIQLLRHRSLSREEDRRFHLDMARADRDEQRAIREHEARIAALRDRGA